MEIRKIRLSDEAAFRAFEQALLEDQATNPFVEWWRIEDFAKFVAQSDQSEIKQVDQTWSTLALWSHPAGVGKASPVA